MSFGIFIGMLLFFNANLYSDDGIPTKLNGIALFPLNIADNVPEFILYLLLKSLIEVFFNLHLSSFSTPRMRISDFLKPCFTKTSRKISSKRIDIYAQTGI